MTHPYRNAVEALHALVEARLAGMNPPSSMGGQIARLDESNPDEPVPLEVYRHCPVCHTWSVHDTCYNCGGETVRDPGGISGRRPKQTRPAGRDIPHAYEAIGTLAAAWHGLSLDDKFVLHLSVIVPPFLDRARRCRACKQVRLGSDTDDGVVYDPVCPACGCTRSERVPGKAVTCAKAVSTYRREKYDRIKRKCKAGVLPWYRLLRVAKLKAPITPKQWGTMSKSALDRWRIVLRGRGLIP